jgi:hypothetical protein
MLRAYFDSNVHSAIAAGGQVPTADVEAFGVTVATGQLLAPISLANLDELVGQVQRDRPATIARLASVRRLVGFHGMLKQPRDLLQQAIEAYAAGAEAPSVMLPEDERRPVVGLFADFIAGSRRHDHDLQEVAAGVRQLKDKWETDMQGARQLANDDLRRVAPRWRDRQALSFADYFAVAGPDMAAAFATPLGREEACRQRGLSGLLDCRPVRFCVGVALSQIYSQTIGEPGQREPRQAARNDGYDIWHAILASTADLFVTFDQRLAEHVERIPGLEGFRVVRSLAALLSPLEVAVTAT